MRVVDWAVSVKPDLVKLQQQTGIPALWAAAQMAHESAVDGGDGLSDLAVKANNYAGLKWAEWERQFGCVPINMQTWEEIGGERQDLTDAFCSCPSWEVWLQVYSSLLTGQTYTGALAYASDPLLYGLNVWQSGWATDSRYIVGVGSWMAQLYDAYVDTIPGKAPEKHETVPIQDNTGRKLCEGWLQNDRTVVMVRPLAEALGMGVGYDSGVVTLTLPPGFKP